MSAFLIGSFGRRFLDSYLIGKAIVYLLLLLINFFGVETSSGFVAVNLIRTCKGFSAGLERVGVVGAGLLKGKKKKPPFQTLS